MNKLLIIRQKTLFFLLIVSTVFLSQCKNARRESSVKQKQETEALIIEYQAMNDSIDHAWNVMIEDDNEKHRLMKRLLLEVSYTNAYDKSRFDTLNDYIERLKVLRYDRKTLADSKRIDDYDSASAAVSDAVIEYAVRHPAYKESKLMKELVDDINEKNSMVLIYRVHYDEFVREREKFIKKNRKKLLRGLKESDLEELPVFTLPA